MRDDLTNATDQKKTNPRNHLVITSFDEPVHPGLHDHIVNDHVDELSEFYVPFDDFSQAA